MKASKIAALLLLLIFSLSTLFACAPVTETVTTYDEAEANALRAEVSGKWTLSEFWVSGEVYTFEEYCKKENADPKEQAISFTFNADGSGEGVFGESKTALTYIYNGKLVTVTTESGSTSFDYDKEKDAFFIYDAQSDTYGYLTRE